jgi:hypothetical protein
MSSDELRNLSQTSYNVLDDPGPRIQWAESQVTDKIYRTHIAPSEEMIRQHAEQGGFPANKVSEVRSTIDPTTAEA